MTIASLKDNLSSKLNGSIATSAIRLRGQKNLPMKDSLTLAFYNIPDGAVIEMVVKTNKK